MSGPRFIEIDGRAICGATYCASAKSGAKPPSRSAGALPSQGRLPAADPEDSERKIRRADAVLTMKPRVRARLFADL